MQIVGMLVQTVVIIVTTVFLRICEFCRSSLLLLLCHTSCNVLGGRLVATYI